VRQGSVILLPVALGDSDWSHWLPRHAQEVACSLRHFVVENAKAARANLSKIGHPIPIRDLSIQELPENATRLDYGNLLAPICQGTDVGLMSDAGCPAVADPGALLVRHCHENQITVRPLVGPSSLMLALMASGLDGQRFCFHGYLPARDPDRSKRIVELERESARQAQTQLFIETPYRNAAMLTSLLETCQGSTRLCVATDLTTASEQVVTKRVSEWRASHKPDLDKRPTVFLFLGENTKQPGCS
jgi:16S rRNA (cytidine1402-2'-O)-methyltransferase